MNKVACVLVTYNRLDLLKQSVDHLLSQDRKVDTIYIVNNASTDGTDKYLNNLKNNPKFKIINLSRNIGGAGGFNKGLEVAYNDGPYDYYWLMDDDTFPKKDALSKLLRVPKLINKPIGFLSSNVLWKDNTPAIMNIPTPIDIWNKQTKNNLIGLSSGSFVSMLVSNEALKECGLPIKDFFIWGDDVEFSRRVSRKFPSYFVPQSVVLHSTKSNSGVDILRDNSDRINRYFYDIRNKIYISREAGSKEKIKNTLRNIYLFGKILFGSTKRKGLKLKVVTKGALSGYFFNPKIKYVGSK